MSRPQILSGLALLKQKCVSVMIDIDGFRLNVGIILTNRNGQVFWAKRIGQNAWQFPQGGIRAHESPEQAMFRELAEEVGLSPDHVSLIGSTRRWLRYRLPAHLIRRHKKPLCIGQKQIWYILRLLEDESVVCLDQGNKPEFDSWRWVNYWYPLKEVVFFKRRVYERALQELAPLVFREKSKALKIHSNYTLLSNPPALRNAPVWNAVYSSGNSK